jgi:hypothetical protein
MAALVCAAVVGLSSAPSANATPYTNRPTLKVSSGIIIIAHYIAVTGNGYVPFENVTISIDTTANVQEVVKADASGHFVTNVLVPGTLLLGTHTIIGTGQFAHDGFDVAKVTVLVIGPGRALIGPIALQRQLVAAPADPLGDNTSGEVGVAVVAGVAGLAVLLLSSGSYLLLTARRRSARR